jgi:hypothetical protein
MDTPDSITTIPVSPDEDFIPVEVQRTQKLGPDFDPDYFAKLDKLLEEEYGPLADFVPISK